MNGLFSAVTTRTFVTQCHLRGMEGIAFYLGILISSVGVIRCPNHNNNPNNSRESGEDSHEISGSGGKWSHGKSKEVELSILQLNIFLIIIRIG